MKWGAMSSVLFLLMSAALLTDCSKSTEPTQSTPPPDDGEPPEEPASTVFFACTGIGWEFSVGGTYHTEDVYYRPTDDPPSIIIAVVAPPVGLYLIFPDTDHPTIFYSSPDYQNPEDFSISYFLSPTSWNSSGPFCAPSQIQVASIEGHEPGDRLIGTFEGDLCTIGNQYPPIRIYGTYNAIISELK